MNIDAISNNTMQYATAASKESAQGNFQDELERKLMSEDEQQLKEACQEVEAYVLANIYKQMKNSTQIGEPLIEKGDYEEMFEDYLIDEYAKEIASTGKLGVADAMYKAMTQYK